MNNMNTMIVKRIKQARIEKGKTQKDLASYLGRTAASISDLERGKVQVTASDLYKISNYLGKPIEYFYGEIFGGKQIQELVTVFRSQSSKFRESNIKYIYKLIRLQMISEEITRLDKEDITVEQMREFLDILIDLTNMNRMAMRKVDNAKKIILSEINFKGIDFSEYFSLLSQ